MTDRYQAKTFAEYLGVTLHRFNSADGDWDRLIYLTVMAINEQVASYEERRNIIPSVIIVTRNDLITMARTAVLSYLFPRVKAENNFDDCMILFILMCLEEKKLIDTDIVFDVAHELMCNAAKFFEVPKPQMPILDFLNDDLHMIDVLNIRMAQVPFEEIIAGVNGLKEAANKIFALLRADVFEFLMGNLSQFQQNYADFATTKTCDENSAMDEISAVINCRDTLCWIAWFYKAVIDYEDTLMSETGVVV